ncbi:universal stress protein [Arcanobacterium ihumii]|uniref:universal stress protein n=1 Tax=Arcanobacterium ihumii TaxID=2138162 RepID=UPI000F52E465|nr:universal stress protein [Arcanobacterium ihumii]
MTLLIPVLASNIESDALASGITFAQEHEGSLQVFLDFSNADYTQDSMNNTIDAISEKLDVADIQYRVETVLRGDDMVEKLTGAARANSNDVVIVGLQSKISQEKVHLGSQIQRILLEVPCAVFILRPDTGDFFEPLQTSRE